MTRTGRILLVTLLALSAAACGGRSTIVVMQGAPVTVLSRADLVSLFNNVSVTYPTAPNDPGPDLYLRGDRADRGLFSKFVNGAYLPGSYRMRGNRLCTVVPELNPAEICARYAVDGQGSLFMVAVGPTRRPPQITPRLTLVQPYRP